MVQIVSQQYIDKAQAGKQRMIRKLVLSASIDIMLNFPNVVLHVMQAFARGSEEYIKRSLAISYSIAGESDDREQQVLNQQQQSMSVLPFGRWNELVVTVCYAMFYLQFLLNLMHIRYLTRNKSTNLRNRASTMVGRRSKQSWTVVQPNRP